MISQKTSVAIDVTPCLGARTGIGRFTFEAFERISRSNDLSITGYAVTWRGRKQLPNLVSDSARIARGPMPARPLHMAWERMTFPPIEWWTGRVDIVHGTNYVVPPARHAARLVTIHDLTPLRFPDLADHHTKTFPKFIAQAIEQGAWVHTSSVFVANEIRERFSIPSDRVVTIAGGVSALGHQDAQSDAERGRQLAGASAYILALGTVEPRKDLPALVDAFAPIAQATSDLRLVIAGADGWGADQLVEAMNRSPVQNRIVRLGRVDEAQRAALLRGATVLAYPSRYEGFGLPPLEAMDASVPVVCTDAGSLPEVVGDAAVLVSAAALEHDRPTGIASLTEALEAVLTDDALRQSLIERGRVRAQAFTWEETATRFAELYARIVNER